MPGEGTLDLSAVTTPDNFQDELPESVRAFQDLLPPLSPLPSPAAILHSNEATDHKEEENNTDHKEEENNTDHEEEEEEENNNTDHTREAALQNSSGSPATAPLDNILALDQNRSLISPSATSSHVLPSSAPSNQPVDNPPEEIVNTRENEAEQHAPPNETSIQPQSPANKQPNTEEIEADKTVKGTPALTLDALARFIGQQLRNPEVHIDPHSTDPWALIPSQHPLSVEEALQHEDLQVPDVLGTGQPSSSTGLYMEDLSPNQRQKIYCGFDSEQGPADRIAISIEQDAPTTETALATYDVDSYIGCLTSLGAAIQGIKCVLVPKATPSIRSSLHLGTFSAYLHSDDGLRDVKQVQVTLDKIPQISLGRLSGDDGFEVILCFRHALRDEQQTTILPERWWDIWMDEIFLPAYYETYSANDSQGYPASAAEAKALSTKRYTEDMRRGKNNNNEPRVQLLSYHLHPSRLGAFYDRILEKIALPGHHMFRDPVLLVIAKGLKGQFRAPCWTTMYDTFFTFLDGILDRRQAMWAFYDWAKEFCPAQSSIRHSRYERPGEVLMWDCRYLHAFYTLLRNLDPAFKHRFQYHPAYFLKGPGDATLEPAQKSLLWKHGLRFVQTYNSVKNFFVAGDFTTGTNEAMADLAVDLNLIRTFQVLGQGIAVDPETLMKGYLHMKWHLDVTLTGSRQKSAGLREEFRGREDLFTAVDAYMRDQDGQPSPSAASRVGSVSPGAFFTMPTDLFTRWARWNLNRLCFGFESIYTIASGCTVAWEQSRMMMLFLRCIPCFMGKGTIGQRARFWYDRYPPRHNIVAGKGAQGFGFLDNMKDYGFAWFADKIDWVTLTFDWRFADYLGFDFSYTERRFKSGPLIRNFKDHILRIQHTTPYFRQWGSDPNCYMILSRYLHQICAHVFRVDVFTHIRKNLAEEYMEDGLAGKIPLCYEAVQAALDPGQCIKMQTAHARQNRLRTWADLWKALWGAPDQTPKPYRDKPYRRVYYECIETIQQTLGPRQAFRWGKEFETLIRCTCWIMPYPSNGRFMHMVGKTYKWWSNYPSELGHYLAPGGKGRSSAHNQALKISDLQWKAGCSSGEWIFRCPYFS